MKNANLSLTKIIILLALPVLSFGLVFMGYFQQDEWLAFEYQLIIRNGGLTELLRQAFYPNIGHYTPLNLIVEATLFRLFELNYIGYAFSSLIAHCAIVIFVYLVSKEIIDSRFAFINASLFAVWQAGSQATLWPLADVGTHYSTLFALLSLLYFVKFYKSPNTKLAIFSNLLLLISTLFKEISIAIWLIYFIILAKKYRIKIFSNVGKMLYLFTPAFYVFARLLMIFTPHLHEADQLATQQQSLKYLILNFLLIPIFATSQSFLPTPHLSSKPLLLIYSIVILGFLFLLTVIFFILIHRNYRNLIPLFLIFTILNSFIIALSPERSGIITLVDKRNLYLPSLGITSLIALAIYIVRNKKNKYILFAFVLIVNIVLANRDAWALKRVADSRKSLIAQINTIFLSTRSKAVYFLDSDSSYYGLPQNIDMLPFQSGLGQMLLILNYESMDLPPDFLGHRFLWDLTSQGHEDHSGQTFGFYRDIGLLAEQIANGEFPIESIEGMRYDSQTNSLLDNSTEIQGRIRGYLTKSTPMDGQNWSASALYNNSEIDNISDNNAFSSWNSQVPYSNPIEISINLNSLNSVAKIEIISGSSIDQNETGYLIMTSVDGASWEQLYYSELAGVSNGKVSLAFEPTLMKYLKIKQIGYHCCAAWVIDELVIYQKI